MNIQRKNSAHHFRMQSEHEQTLGKIFGPLEVHYMVNLSDLLQLLRCPTLYWPKYKPVNIYLHINVK